MFKIRRKTWAFLLVYIVGVSGYIYYLYAETKGILTANLNDKLRHAALGGRPSSATATMITW